MRQAMEAAIGEAPQRRSQQLEAGGFLLVPQTTNASTHPCLAGGSSASPRRRESEYVEPGAGGEKSGGWGGPSRVGGGQRREFRRIHLTMVTARATRPPLSFLEPTLCCAPSGHPIS